MKSIPWSKKYCPDLDGFRGQQGVTELVKAFDKWKKGKAILVHGFSGTGKTSSVHALARKKSLEIVELNASDMRNADAINGLLGNVIRQRSLFFRGKMVLVDEADGISGNKDRGGLQALAKLIEDSIFPIVITANEVSDQKFKALRKKSVLIEYKKLNYISIFELLKDVCIKEQVDYDDSGLKMLARTADGDARAALNDLQAISNRKVTQEQIQELSARDTHEAVTDALLKVFKTTKPDIALGAYDNLNEDIDKLFLWLEENIPREYEKPKDLARAMKILAEADKYRGRIRRWQYYRYYVYIYNLLSAGIALAKDEKYSKMTDFRPTTRILKIWMSKQKNFRKNAVAEKIAESTHTSTRVALQNFLYYSRIFKKNPDEFCLQFSLEKEEMEWLKKTA